MDSRVQVAAYKSDHEPLPPDSRVQVSAYMSGHEHDLQYIESPARPAAAGGTADAAASQPHTVSYVVSGAGSDVRKGEFDGIKDKVRSRGGGCL